MWSDNLTGFILMLSLRDELHRSNFAVTYAGAYLTLSLVWKIFFPILNSMFTNQIRCSHGDRLGQKLKCFQPGV